MRSLLLFLAACVTAYAANPRAIDVSGKSEGSVAPDTAVWRFDIYATANTVDMAAAEVQIARDRMMTRLAELKISPDSLASEGISQGALWRYDNGRRRSNGYFSEYFYKLTVNDVKQYEPITEKFFLDGKIQVNGVSLSSKNEREAYRAQIVRALVDARANAEVIAAQLNLQLGRVLEVHVNDFASGREMFGVGLRNASSVSSESPPLTSIPVSAMVQVEYEIAP